MKNKMDAHKLKNKVSVSKMTKEAFKQQLFIFVFACFAKFSHGEITKFAPQKLALALPEDVGHGHSQIIHDLQEQLAKKQPANGREYLQFISLIMMEHFCKLDSLQCNKNMAELTTSITLGPQGNVSSGYEHVSMNLLPEDFDPQVLTSLKKLFDTISMAELHENPENILIILNEEFEDLKNSENAIDEDHRLVGLLTYSVGMESLKQWYEVLNDKTNPFYQMLLLLSPRKKRYLQTEALLNSLTDEAIEQIDFIRLIEADMIGAAAGAIAAVFDSSGDILSNALTQASLASLKQVANEIVPDVTGCLFPESQLCNPTGNPQGPDNPNNPDGNCLFPNWSICIPFGNNGSENTDPDILNGPDSNNGNNPTDTSNPNEDNNANNGNNPTDTSNPNENNDTEGPGNSILPEITGCLFPNSESCNTASEESENPNDQSQVTENPENENNQGISNSLNNLWDAVTENNEDSNINANQDIPTFCELFPNSSGCSN